VNRAIIAHYDRLIEMDNDPARDPKPLREYMDKWDGDAFFDLLELDKSKSVLEIGVGTGRLAMRAARECGGFTGIDIAPKTVERARENLEGMKNASLICGDFLEHEFAEKFDVIYSSLTFMHIQRKQHAAAKIASLLNDGGHAVVSIDKNRQPFIDAGFGKLDIWPDDPEQISECFRMAGLRLETIRETEFAFMISASNQRLR